MIEMERDEEVHEELKKVAPGFPGKTSTPVPEGYFDLLPAKVIDRWRNQDAAQPKLQESNGPARMITLRGMMAAAAVVSGICLGVLWFSHPTPEVTVSPAISATEAYEYIMDNMEEFAPLIQEQDQLVKDAVVPIKDTTGIEQFLIEELDGDDIENIF